MTHPSNSLETLPPGTPPATSPGRRKALQIIAFILGGLATVAMSIPLVGYFLGTLIKKHPDVWIDLGPISQFPEGQTRYVDNFRNPYTQPWDGASAKSSAYVRRIQGEQFQVFAVNCAHLGCPVSWFPQSGLFMCPCHGGVYYEDGSHASGPPPRGLFEYDFRIVNGRLEIKGGHMPTLHDTLRQASLGQGKQGPSKNCQSKQGEA